MRRILSALALSLAFAAPALAQDAPTAVVSIYRAAPGQQVALIKWLAAQEKASVAAGVAASQLYVHQQGASWDYVLISPPTTAEQDKAVDAEARKLGVTTGPASGIEIRQYIAEHSDTLAAGPMTASDFLKKIGQ